MRYLFIVLGLIFVVVAFNHDDYWTGFWYALAAACSIVIAMVMAFFRDAANEEEDDFWEMR